MEWEFESRSYRQFVPWNMSFRSGICDFFEFSFRFFLPPPAGDFLVFVQRNNGNLRVFLRISELSETGLF